MTKQKKGLWLKLFCPEDACLREEERIDLLKQDTADEADSIAEEWEDDLWLAAFCPERSCEVGSFTDLP